MPASIILVAAIAAAQPSAPAELGGHWEGRLAVNGQAIRIVFRITEAPDGQVSVVMDSPDQGALDIPAEGPTVEGGVVRIGVAAIGGRFEGALSGDGATLTGSLHQGGATLPLILTRTGEASPLSRPQTPQPPFPYSEEEVVIDTPTDGVRLAGTLTLPAGEGPFPAALLITGSGGQDRNETVFGHQPFLVLADALSRRGVAVLRVDDRGVGGSTGPVDTATSADFAIDAAAAFAWLAQRPGIDDDDVGLIGHSEGGTIAPLVAQMDPRVAWVAMIAGPALPGADVMVEQTRRTVQSMGVAPMLVDLSVTNQSRIMEAIAANAGDAEAARAAVAAIFMEAGQSETQAREAAANATGAWFRWFVAHDPRPALRELDAPLLAIYGGKDVQVDAGTNAAALRETVPSAAVVILPELNHLMQTAETGLPNEYAEIEETFDPEALDLLVEWVAARSGLTD